MNKKTMQGQCLCGAVTMSTAPQHKVAACHCGMCRKWGGGPYLAVHCGTDIQITGEEHIAQYDSSDWAARAFCKCCGTHLFYRFKPTNEYIVSAGFFDAQASFMFTEQIFIDHKPAYYDFANPTQNLTEQQVIAQYKPE